MMPRTWNPVIHNLALLAFGALPLAIVGGWAVAVLFPAEWMKGTARSSAGEYASGFLFWFVVLIIPVLMGGLLHQVAIRTVPPSWSRVQQRIAIVATAVVIPVGFLLIGNSPMLFRSWKLIVPILVGMTFYGLLAKPLKGVGDE